jgi:hypothetical protein
MKVTRRQLAAVVSATALAQAQTPGPAAAPADELQAARDRLKANRDALTHYDLPASTEPAFRFQA